MKALRLRLMRHMNILNMSKWWANIHVLDYHSVLDVIIYYYSYFTISHILCFYLFFLRKQQCESGQREPKEKIMLNNELKLIKLLKFSVCSSLQPNLI